MPPVCVPGGFCEIAGTEVSMDHIYPQSVLATITLVDVRLEVAE